MSDLRNLNISKENGELTDDQFFISIFRLIPSKSDEFKSSLNSFLAPKGYDIMDFTKSDLHEAMAQSGLFYDDFDAQKRPTKLECMNRMIDYLKNTISITATLLDSEPMAAGESLENRVFMAATLLFFSDDFYKQCLEEVYGGDKYYKRPRFNPGLDSPSQFDSDNYLRKIMEEQGGFYKGDDIKNYYKDWYEKVIEHPLFDNYIKARIYSSTARLINIGASFSLPDSTFCKPEMLTPLNPEQESDMRYVIKVSDCVVQNITKVFQTEIPEFNELSKNREASWDFQYYMIIVYQNPFND